MDESIPYECFHTARLPSLSCSSETLIFIVLLCAQGARCAARGCDRQQGGYGAVPAGEWSDRGPLEPGVCVSRDGV